MGELFIFIGMCLLGAFCVIGLIEWVKSVRDAIIAAVKKTGKISTIAWPILSLVFAVGMGFALGKMPQSTIFGNTYNAIIFSSMLMLSFNEILGYNVIVKLIFHVVDKVVYGDKIPEQVPKSITDKIKDGVTEAKAALTETKTDYTTASTGTTTETPAVTTTETTEATAGTTTTTGSGA